MHTTIDIKKLLPINAAFAPYIAVTRNTLNKWARHGLIPGAHQLSGRWFCTDEAARAFCRVPSPAGALTTLGA